MRTQKEILERIKARAKDDMFGFEWTEYLNALTKESAESLKGDLLKADADLSKFETSINTIEDAKKAACDYMSFAWEKANGCRGISANRSIMHYIAWLWLMGEDAFDDLMDGYEYYGKPQLVRICEFLGLDSKTWDDGIRSNTEY